MNKKIIIILIASILLLLLVSAAIIYTQTSSVGAYSKKFEQVVIDNEWATSSNFDSCKKVPKNCIVISVMYIKGGLQLRADYTNYNMASLDTEFNKINSLINEKKYKQALQKSEEVIKKVNINYGKYVDTNQKNFTDIDSLTKKIPNITFDFADINYRIIDNWALVTLLPKTGGDVANVILQKDNNKTWAILVGPGTFFDNEALDKYASMPSRIKAGANTINSLVIVHNPKVKKPAPIVAAANLTNNVSIDPLSERLPYDTKYFSVESSIVDGLPIYTVSYYETTDNSLETTKTAVKAWLVDIGITVSDSSLKYKLLKVSVPKNPSE